MALPSRPIEQITEVDISRLAREIARDLKPLEFTLEKLGISSEAFDRVQNSEIFKTRLSEEAAVWSSHTKQSIRERVATKAAIAIEELLRDAIQLVQDPEVPGAARVQALQFIAKLGQLGDGAAATDDGSGRVQININIAGSRVSFDKETQPKTIEGDVVTSEVRP
jgi:hypothetical protein